jgi:hypothetical protein
MPAFAAGLHVPTLPMARNILFFPLRLLCSHLRVVWLTAQCTFSWWPTMRIVKKLVRSLPAVLIYFLRDTATLYYGADFILHQISHISDLSWPRQNSLLVLPTASRSGPHFRNWKIQRQCLVFYPHLRNGACLGCIRAMLQFPFLCEGGTTFLIF